MIASLSAGCVTGSSNLKLVTTMSDNRGFYVDEESIVTDGSTRRFRLVIDLPSAAEDGTKSRLSFEEADCDAMRSRSLEESIFNGPLATGTVMRESKIASEWSGDAKGMPMYTVLEYVCKAAPR